MKRYFALLLASCALAFLSSCNESNNSGETAVPAAADSNARANREVSPPATVQNQERLPMTAETSFLVGIGNNWKLDMKKSSTGLTAKLTLDSGVLTGMVQNQVGEPTRDGGRRLIYKGSLSGQETEISITRSECKDKNEISHAMSVAISTGGKTYTGCADFGTARTAK